MKLRIVPIILIALVILILYILFNVVYSSIPLIQQNYLGTGLVPIPMNKIKDYQMNTYFYEIWVYVNSLDNASAITSTIPVGSANKKGNIFYVEDMISLDLYKNTSMYVNVYNTSSLNPNKYDNYNITQALPLQKWQQVIISVQNYVMDLYLNGKLIKSIELSSSKGIPIPKTNSTINFGSSDVYIAKFNRVSSTLSTTMAWDKYMAGNSTIAPIHANLTLTTDPKNGTTRIDLF
jgi:hypothetical protein